MNVSPQWPLNIYATYFLHEAVRLPKQVGTDQTTESVIMIYTICNEQGRGSRVETSEEHDQVHPIPDEIATSRILNVNNIAAVHYKPTKNWDSEMTRHWVVQTDDSKHLSEDWRTEVQLSKKYAQYQDEFLSMLFDFWPMWDGHF